MEEGEEGGRGNGRREEGEQEEKTALSKMFLRKKGHWLSAVMSTAVWIGAGVFAGSFLSMCVCWGVGTSLTCQCQTGIM